MIKKLSIKKEADNKDYNSFILKGQTWAISKRLDEQKNTYMSILVELSKPLEMSEFENIINEGKSKAGLFGYSKMGEASLFKSDKINSFVLGIKII